MSYAIIRNQNHKIGGVKLIERHNERQNQHYSNPDIDLSRSSLNYHLKKPTGSYLDTFYAIRESEHLKGNLRVNGKKQSTILCEFIITSDNEFFDRIGEEQTRKFFEDAYSFVSTKVGGEQYIVSATVHMDETTPHMHCSFIPVVQGRDRKGEPCKRINGSEFWKGRDSYSRLQDEFYSWITSHGFNLERGNKGSTAEHLSTEEYKLNKVKEEAERVHKQRKADEQKSVKLKSEIAEFEHALTAAVSETKETKTVRSIFGIKEVMKTAEELQHDKEIAAAKLVLQRETAVSKREADCAAREKNLTDQIAAVRADERQQAAKRQHTALSKARKEAEAEHKKMQMQIDRLTAENAKIRESYNQIKEKYENLQSKIKPTFSNTQNNISRDDMTEALYFYVDSISKKNKSTKKDYSL